jgi:hypothetical protein
MEQKSIDHSNTPLDILIEMLYHKNKACATIEENLESKNAHFVVMEMAVELAPTVGALSVTGDDTCDDKHRKSLRKSRQFALAPT